MLKCIDGRLSVIWFVASSWTNLRDELKKRQTSQTTMLQHLKQLNRHKEAPKTVGGFRRASRKKRRNYRLIDRIRNYPLGEFLVEIYVRSGAHRTAATLEITCKCNIGSAHAEWPLRTPPESRRRSQQRFRHPSSRGLHEKGLRLHLGRLSYKCVFNT